ncbi:MAG: S-layer homology domain-containing protein [Firmicutes bacterium]|nr:S-layer homology domain-containing protein [Bacillota bacterium]
MKTGTKKLCHVLLALIMIFSLLPAFGMTAGAASPLPGFAGSGGKIHWEPVAGADHYRLRGLDDGPSYLNLQKGGYSFSDSFTWSGSVISFDLLKYMDVCGDYEEKTYTVIVAAYKGSQDLGYSSTYQYTYKSAIPQLDTPANLRWNGKKISWNPVSGIDYYWVGVYSSSKSLPVWADEVETASADLTKKSGYSEDPPVEFSAGEQYFFKVRAKQFEYQKTARDSNLAVSETITGRMAMNGYKTGDTFKLTVTDGTASKTSVKYGEKVTVTASAKEGYRFDYWEVLTSGVNVGNTKNEKLTFNMPDRDVSLKAAYVLLPAVDKVVLALTKPVAGEKPASTMFCAGAQLDKLTWYRRVITERGIEDWEVMPASASFQAGKRYLAKMELRPDSGYIFPDQSNLMVIFNNGQLGGGMTSLTPTSMVIQKEFTASAANPFKDVSADQYYYNAVIWAVNHKPYAITTGTDKDTFSPDLKCTRGQVVTFLWRMAGCPKPSGSAGKFEDVQSSEYYYDAVRWAVEKNITNGTSDHEFSPDAACTRGQVVTFLHRYHDKPKPASAVNLFKDISSGEYYYDAVLWAVGKNITNGTSDHEFSPNDFCTRGQIVTFLYRDETGK